jgi:hypothetical protein
MIAPLAAFQAIDEPDFYHHMVPGKIHLVLLHQSTSIFALHAHSSQKM